MRKILQVSSLLVLLAFINSCASGYKAINPTQLNYVSKSNENEVLLEYKYDLLDKKFKKKESQNGVKLIALKITNNSQKDIVFGENFKLFYENGNQVSMVDSDKLYNLIKQNTASYLWYLLLTPVQVYSTTSTTTNGAVTQTKPVSSFPIGVILGPGLSAGNMLISSNANTNFQNELIEFNIAGKTIKKGETVFGLMGLYSTNYDAIKIKME